MNSLTFSEDYFPENISIDFECVFNIRRVSFFRTRTIDLPADVLCCQQPCTSNQWERAIVVVDGTLLRHGLLALITLLAPSQSLEQSTLHQTLRINYSLDLRSMSVLMNERETEIRLNIEELIACRKFRCKSSN
jgi:hypothetical protein